MTEFLRASLPALLCLAFSSCGPNADASSRVGLGQKSGMKTAGRLILLLAISLSAVSCGAIGVLGPGDKPKFETFKWTRMVIRYSYVPSAERRSMTVTVEDPAVLRAGFSLMDVRRIRPLSFPSQKHIELQSSDHGGWDMMRSTYGYSLSSKEDNWRSYSLEMKDERFHNWLAQICVADLKRRGLKATRGTWIYTEVKGGVVK